MTRDELKLAISFLANDNNEQHIIIYTVDVAENVRFLDIADILQPEIQELFSQKVLTVFNNDNYELLDYSTADRRDDCYYVYDLEEVPNHMQLMQNVIGDDTIAQYDFNNDSLELVKAFIIVLSSADGSVVSLFKPISDVEKYLRRRDFIIRESNHRFVRNDTDMIRVSPGFQMAYIDGHIIMLQPSKLVKLIGLDKVLVNASKTEAERLRKKNILEDVGQLTQYCNDDPKFCKALIASIKDSPLFDPQHPKTVRDAIEYAKRVNKKFRKDGKFHFNDRGDRFVIGNKLQAERFIRLIENDYLNSDWTGSMFESLAKNKL